jgi:hypothetical protein
MISNEITGYIISHKWIIVLLAAWITPWKGIALWKAAKRNNPAWFVAILVLNTLAILEIVYIFAISRREPGSPKSSPEKAREDRKSVVLDIKGQD